MDGRRASLSDSQVLACGRGRGHRAVVELAHGFVLPIRVEGLCPKLSSSLPHVQVAQSEARN